MTLDMTKTSEALALRDEFEPRIQRAIDNSLSGPGDLPQPEFNLLNAWMEALDENVGYAYGQDTKDRNDPKACQQLVRPGPSVPVPGAELSLVRKYVKEWRLSKACKLKKVWLGLDGYGDLVKGGHNRPRLYTNTRESAIKWAQEDDRIYALVEFNVEDVVWTKPFPTRATTT